MTITELLDNAVGSGLRTYKGVAVTEMQYADLRREAWRSENVRVADAISSKRVFGLEVRIVDPTAPVPDGFLDAREQ